MVEEAEASSHRLQSECKNGIGEKKRERRSRKTKKRSKQRILSKRLKSQE